MWDLNFFQYIEKKYSYGEAYSMQVTNKEGMEILIIECK